MTCFFNVATKNIFVTHIIFLGQHWFKTIVDFNTCVGCIQFYVFIHCCLYCSTYNLTKNKQTNKQIKHMKPFYINMKVSESKVKLFSRAL